MIKQKPLSVWKCKECGSTKKSTYKELCHNCYGKRWSKNPKAKEKMANYVKNYAHKNKDKINEKAKNAYKRNRKRFIVRTETRQKNEKVGICFDCKEKGKTEFHHFSYEPNIFIEVCRKCHNKRHGRETYER